MTQHSTSHIDKVVHKMVAADDIKINKIPFMVAFRFNKDAKAMRCGKPHMPRCTLGCTGSLISSKWVLSATHCLGSKKDININKCDLEGITCNRNKYSDFEIIPGEVHSYIYVNVQDFIQDEGRHEKYEIRRIIRPRKAYPSAGYGVSQKTKK